MNGDLESNEDPENPPIPKQEKEETHPCGCERDPHLCGLFTLLFLLSAIVSMIVLYIIYFTKDAFILYVILPAAFVFIFWIVYIIEWNCNNSAKYLRNLDLTQDLKTHIQTIKNTEPTMTYKCECYHFETRSRTVNGKTQTYRIRVTSFRGQENFLFSKCVDNSSEVDDDVGNYSVVRLKCTSTYQWGDFQTKNEFDRRKIEFDNRYRHRDTYYHSYFRYNLNGYQQRMLCVVDVNRVSPNLSYCCYNVFSFFLCGSYPYRMWLEKKSIKTHFNVDKIIY